MSPERSQNKQHNHNKSWHDSWSPHSVPKGPTSVSDSMAIKSCGSDSHDVTVGDPSPGHYPMGLGRSLDLRWMEKVASGGIEVDD